ncbi:MAG: LacI family DNA-binding transcriptional regulator [Verrucomicrobiota bacterium]|nr:LacI family DNA-binding transcriptional regulator [Verrucomicrobiota bacterium]
MGNDKQHPSGTRVTLASVAREAGLSITTVSDILLRGVDSRYNQGTCKRVRKLADEMGYTPSRAAQQLAKGRSGEIGLLLTRALNNPYWARALSDIEKELRKRGYRLQLTVIDTLAEDPAKHLRELIEGRVEALIVGPIHDPVRFERIKAVLPKDFPICTFGLDLGDFDMVGVDEESSAHQATRHLVDMGHRRISYLCPPEADFTKLNQMKAVLQSVGLVFDPNWLSTHTDTGQFDEISRICMAFANQWNAAPPDTRPTAMVCHSDSVALSAISAFNQSGIRVPEDLSLIGCDNLPESPYLLPALTSMDCRIDEQMAAAVDLAITRIKNPRRKRETRIFDPQLIPRASVRNLRAQEETDGKSF